VLLHERQYGTKIKTGEGRFLTAFGYGGDQALWGWIVETQPLKCLVEKELEPNWALRHVTISDNL
jgi:hypothetical protein